MAYIGNAPADRFTSIPTVQQFNGDGSTTAFTLSRPVGTDQDLLVSVDGVIQDTAAYAVSNGTTLTFSAAPSTGTANIFVNYLGVTIGSVVHPASSALAATTGVFNDAVGIAKSPASGVAFDVRNNSTTNIADLRNANSSGFGLYSAGGSTSSQYALRAADKDNTALFSVLSDGSVTAPKQPAFLAKPGSNQDNIATGGVTIAFGTEIFDQNADFASNTFTAPVTGKYLLTACIRLGAVDSASSRYELKIQTSNRNYNYNFDPDFGQDAVTWTAAFSVLADMDASDTSIVSINQTAGTAQTDVHTDSTFSGYLAC